MSTRHDGLSAHHHERTPETLETMTTPTTDPFADYKAGEVTAPTVAILGSIGLGMSHRPPRPRTAAAGPRDPRLVAPAVVDHGVRRADVAHP